MSSRGGQEGPLWLGAGIIPLHAPGERKTFLLFLESRTAAPVIAIPGPRAVEDETR